MFKKNAILNLFIYFDFRKQKNQNVIEILSQKFIKKLKYLF